MFIVNFNLEIFAVVVSVVILIFMSVFVYFQHQTEIEKAGTIAAERDLALLQTAATNFPQTLGLVFSDVKIISQLTALNEYLAEPTDEKKIKLQNLFLSFSKNRKVYDQIRYLDATGQEMVRVNYVPGKAEIVPEDKLQNKKGRYYFDEAFALSEGQIYVSPLDLNVEQNKIEEPYKPMLRVAMPLFFNAEKKGIIIVNYLAQELIDQVASIDQLDGHRKVRTNFVNKAGYWFFGVDSSHLWGFMFDERKNESLANAKPELWATFQKQPSGQVFLPDGLYTYTQINVPEIASFNWRVYVFDPKENIYNYVYEYSKQNSFVVLVLGLFFLVINFLLFKLIDRARRIKEKQTESEILYKNIYENATDAIMLLSPPNWTFSSGNKATLKMFNVNSEEEFIKYTPDKLSPVNQPDGQPLSKKALEMIQLALERGQNSFDWVHKDSTGNEFAAKVSLGRVHVGDKIMIQAIVRDVSEELKMEAIKKENQAKTLAALQEAERFNKLMVGREIEMIRLKKELGELRKQDQNSK